jgi:hypothetical protein
MRKILKFVAYFGVLAGFGVLLGCYVHGLRTNQPMIMSGVAFVRELPYGEPVVGYTESFTFALIEKWNLWRFKRENPKIELNPEVARDHNTRFNRGSSGQ